MRKTQKEIDFKEQVNETSPSMRRLLLKLLGHLSRKRRLQLFALLLVMVTMLAAEVLSLTAVLPFLAVLNQALWNHTVFQKWGLSLYFTF